MYKRQDGPRLSLTDPELAPFVYRLHTVSVHRGNITFTLCGICAVLEHIKWSHDGLKQRAIGLKRCCKDESLGSVKSIRLRPILMHMLFSLCCIEQLLLN